MIAVIDLGFGNIGSVLNMLYKIGAEACPTSEAERIRTADRIILPGVGAFDYGMKQLESAGIIDALREKVHQGVPLLGICLGMHLLGDSSEEGKRQGLGFIPGKVIRIPETDDGAALKVPHMGWNQLRYHNSHPLLTNLDRDPRSRFYFVHSYHFVPTSNGLIATTPYGGDLTAMIARENIMGVQFHPEKSHKYGMQLLRNFMELKTCVHG